ncbi:hypothetical protein [Glycomyces sp. YM15]|uniref:hypothetical protein n=1 Tax=Glycomyces sp. YM15 TaxID=2800446 RepID=UPI0019638F21|nr:hypothetical protein [Glycomyces sp. YM15]
MSRRQKILDFSTIANPRWRLVAREYFMSRLAPLHPAVAVLPRAFRTPLDPTSAYHLLRPLTAWFAYLTSEGVTTLYQVSQTHCDTFLQEVSRTKTDPGRSVSLSTLTGYVRSTQNLTLYSEILSDTYRPGFRPWGNRSAPEVTGYSKPTANLVPPVPDELLRPLLAGTRYLLEVVGPHLAAETRAVRAVDRGEATFGFVVKPNDREGLRETIERLRLQGVPAPRISPSGFAHRAHHGWDPSDPLFHLSWHPAVVDTGGTMKHRPDLEQFRPELERWIAECGIEPPWGRGAAQVARADTGEAVPWTLPMDRIALQHMGYIVLSAAFFVTAALSGMRPSELHELTAGAHQREERPGGTRYRVVSRRHKGEAFGGVEDAWVVIEDVYRALEMAQQITGLAPGELLFAKSSNTAHVRYTRMRQWINGPSGRRLGLEPIPDGPVHPQALRRTLALMIAQRPHGLMAAKVQLKHISVATTEGYAARPGGHQAAFLAEVSAVEEAEHTRLTVEAYDQYRQGILPTGKGARDLIATFQAVDHALDRQEPGPVTVIDDRRVERLLKAKAKNLHVGVGNYCWFTDPRKALCLTLAGNTEATEPLLGLCDSARCSQATHHPRHREVWADHAEQTRVVFLGNPRLSKHERDRAQASFDRSIRIVNEIDTAASEQDDPDGQ